MGFYRLKGQGPIVPGLKHVRAGGGGGGSVRSFPFCVVGLEGHGLAGTGL